MQKVAKVKEARKRREKVQEKTLAKKSKFWLMRMHQIKIFHSFVPNLVGIYQFGQKIVLSVKLWPI